MEKKSQIPLLMCSQNEAVIFRELPVFKGVNDEILAFLKIGQVYKVLLNNGEIILLIGGDGVRGQLSRKEARGIWAELVVAQSFENCHQCGNCANPCH